jgi:IS1 family transposase
VLPGEKERGDVYVFIALAATSKAVLSYVVGKRTVPHAEAFVADLRARVVNRPQITSDGWPVYPDAIAFAFGDDVDFATIVKNYAVTPGNEAAVRYSPGSIRSTERSAIFGDPDPERISTSYVERFNLTTRMQMRRFTRLTNGFSKKLANHRAAIALHIAHYNLCRTHEAVRCTPAMALGVTDHVWSIGELVTAALAAPEPPPLVRPTRARGMSAGKAKDEKGGGGRHWLHMVKGGKAPK